MRRRRRAKDSLNKSSGLCAALQQTGATTAQRKLSLGADFLRIDDAFCFGNSEAVMHYACDAGRVRTL